MLGVVVRTYVINGVNYKPRLEDERDNPLPLQPELQPLSRDILGTFPVLGTVLRVVFDQGIKRHGLHLLNIGKWMKFVNLYCEVNRGLWRGVLRQTTKFRYTPDSDRLVSERLRLYASTEMSFCFILFCHCQTCVLVKSFM